MIDFYDMSASLYRRRWLLFELVSRDLKLRYRGSVFGFAWTLLNPLIFMGVYVLVFSVFLKMNIPNFPLYLLTGLIPWYWFLGAISQSVGAILDGRTFVGKTVFPIELLVLVPVITNGINFALSMILVVILTYALGVHPGWAILALIPIVAIQFLLVLGISFLVATFNVFYRDLQQLIGYALTLVFFLTPIFYARNFIPPQYKFIITLNPFAAVISCYQDILYYGRFPGATELAISAVVAVFVAGAGIGYFNRYRDAFGEYV